MMRKMAMAVIILAAILAMTACNGIGERTPTQGKASYPPELAVKNGDVVNLHGKISNMDKFIAFVNNYDKGKSGQVRITMYSIEGSPIFYDLNYTGKEIRYTFDNSKDAYGGKGKGKQSTSCAKLEKKTDDKGTQYTLSECSGNNSRLGESFYFLIPTLTSLITIEHSSHIG